MVQKVGLGSNHTNNEMPTKKPGIFLPSLPLNFPMLPHCFKFVCVTIWLKQRCPSLNFFLEPEPSFFGFVFLREPESDLFWFSFFGGSQSQSFFVLSFSGEPEPELTKLDRPGSSWSRVNVVLVMVMF